MARTRKNKLPKKIPNWNQLFSKLEMVYKLNGKTRDVSVLNNFRNHKENICRKLGVICDADVTRISSKLKKTKTKTKTGQGDRQWESS